MTDEDQLRSHQQQQILVTRGQESIQNTYQPIDNDDLTTQEGETNTQRHTGDTAAATSIGTPVLVHSGSIKHLALQQLQRRAERSSPLRGKPSPLQVTSEPSSKSSSRRTSPNDTSTSTTPSPPQLGTFDYPLDDRDSQDIDPYATPPDSPTLLHSSSNRSTPTNRILSASNSPSRLITSPGTNRRISPINLLLSEFSLTDGFDTIRVFTPKRFITNSAPPIQTSEGMATQPELQSQPLQSDEGLSSIESVLSTPPTSNPPSPPKGAGRVLGSPSAAISTDSRRGSLTTLHAHAMGSVMKSIKPTSSFPIPSQPSASPSATSSSPPVSPGATARKYPPSIGRSPSGPQRTLFPDAPNTNTSAAVPIGSSFATAAASSANHQQWTSIESLPPSAMNISPSQAMQQQHLMHSQGALPQGLLPPASSPPAHSISAPPAIPSSSTPATRSPGDSTRAAAHIPPLPPLHARGAGPAMSFPYFLAQQQNMYAAAQAQQAHQLWQAQMAQLSPQSQQQAQSYMWDATQGQTNQQQPYAYSTSQYASSSLPQQPQLYPPASPPSVSPDYDAALTTGTFANRQGLTQEQLKLQQYLLQQQQHQQLAESTSMESLDQQHHGGSGTRSDEVTHSTQQESHIDRRRSSSSDGGGGGEGDGSASSGSRSRSSSSGGEGGGGDGGDDSPGELRGGSARHSQAEDLYRVGSAGVGSGAGLSFTGSKEDLLSSAEAPAYNTNNAATALQMRKAASAADFKSYNAASSAGSSSSSKQQQRARNLGVLTTFYTPAMFSLPPLNSGSGSQPHSAVSLNGAGGSCSGNASSNSLAGNANNPFLMRPSTSHAVLSSQSQSHTSTSSTALLRPTSASTSRSSEAVPPLVPQFSLGHNFVNYDGTSRKRRTEIAMVTDKLRDMQYEIGRLSRKIKEYEEDTEQWSLRYSRRIVILSNVSLGCWIFLLQFLDGLRTRTVKNSFLTRLFIPRNILAMASAAGGASGVAGGGGHAGGLPLSAVLISGFLTGIQSSAFFILSAGLQIRTQSWKRNAGFILSTAYSLYLVLLRRKEFRPHITNWFNIVANIIYAGARYYFLHGLLVFNSMRIL